MEKLFDTQENAWLMNLNKMTISFSKFFDPEPQQSPYFLRNVVI